MSSILFSILLSCIGEKQTGEIKDTVQEIEEDTGNIEEDIENPLFYLAENGITVMCPDAPIRDSEELNGVVYSKLSQLELKTLIEEQNWAAVEATCTSGITDMSEMFAYTESFDGDISGWDVSNVTSMSMMFVLSDFSGDISDWDVSNVTNMNGMFEYSSFDGDISGWNIGSVTNMKEMFRDSSFNGDISGWNVSNVTNMGMMFRGTLSFNSNISGWNVSSVMGAYTDSLATYPHGMGAMFRDAISFNQDLSSWCVFNFPSEPIDFDDGASSWTEPRPVWGTCP